MSDAFIAVDWGTTNRRAYRIEDGIVVVTERDGLGVTSVPREKFSDEIAGLRSRLGDLPMLCAGMVGSVRGWVDVPYLPCPADLAKLASALHWVDQRTAIVPGLSHGTPRRADVMRGEEVQLLGAVVGGHVPLDAMLCQPGTHCKWARIDRGTISGFHTAMTGEIFALLRRESLLADFLTGAVADGPAFADGVAAAQDATLLGDLFGARASVLLGRRSANDTASYVSGLLIGSDVREQRLQPGEAVHLLADPILGGLYTSAITACGALALPIDSHAAFVAGITQIWSLAHASQP